MSFVSFDEPDYLRFHRISSVVVEIDPRPYKITEDFKNHKLSISKQLTTRISAKSLTNNQKSQNL